MTSLKNLLISLRNRPVSIEVSGGVIHVKTSGADRILKWGKTPSPSATSTTRTARPATASTG